MSSLALHLSLANNSKTSSNSINVNNKATNMIKSDKQEINNINNNNKHSNHFQSKSYNVSFSNNNNQTNKKNSNTLIYNNLASETIMETSANTASNLAFLNRIKTLESKKTKTPTPNSKTQTTNDLTDHSYLNFNNQTTQSPTLDRKSAKTQRMTPKPTEDSTKYRLSKNAYQDKITDQKFFSRGFKIVQNKIQFESNSFSNSQNPNEMVSHLTNSYNQTNRYLNESPSNLDNNPSKSSFYSSNQAQFQSNSINMNRLKLLKKRNALKKGSNQNESISPTMQLNSSSKEDLKSQTSFNQNLTNRAYSTHLSRNSLHNIDQSNFSSNQQLNINKSNETIDELYLNENNHIKLKSNLNRVRSTPHIVQINTNGLTSSKHQTHNSSNVNIRTKSENEIINLPDGLKLKETSQNNLNSLSSIQKALANNNSFINRIKLANGNNNSISNQNQNSINQTNPSKSRPVSRLDTVNSSSLIKPRHSISKENGDLKTPRTVSDSTSNNDDFKIIFPGQINNDLRKTLNPSNNKENNNVNSLQLIYDTKLGYELFEPSPYNIMSDPVISEQFRKLYQEDEYFQQVNKKCCEWLHKYVFPEYESYKKQQILI